MASKSNAAGTALALLLVFGSAPALSQAPDFSGTWLSAAEFGNAWEPASLPLTSVGQARLSSFDSQRLDSTAFCMPFGTPRNTLNTAERPLQIIQTNTQLTLLFEGLGDVRRVFIDGRSHPPEPIPSWMGHSVGEWSGSTLEVDTVAMTSESILTDAGLPHSDAMQVREAWRLVERSGETLLQLDMQITDPEFYQQPLTATRYFRRVAHAPLGEGSSQCLLDQWRRRLEQLNREMFRDLTAAGTEQRQ